MFARVIEAANFEVCLCGERGEEPALRDMDHIDDMYCSATRGTTTITCSVQGASHGQPGRTPACG